jgi:NAD(P)-dependent dehydrogenase (short-subunit alcohol dehydrogenase family)
MELPLSKPIDQQTVVVTGAAQGLGAAIAEHFAGLGAQLVLFDYNRDGLERTTRACKGRARGIVVDLSSAEDTEQAITKGLDGIASVDTLVHNAAILVPTPFDRMTLTSFRATLDVGLQAAFQLTSAIWPGMQAAGGALIYVSSRSGVMGFADETAYCAAKHGLEGFARSLALEGEPFGIAASTITPGMYMHTPMSERTYSAELRQ